MHPIEHLRYVARASGVPQRLVVAETARALSGFATDPQGLVTACRRVVERHRSCGSLVWMAASVMQAADPVGELRRTAAAVATDRTGRVVADNLPADAAVVVVGWPAETASELPRRGDVAVLAVDTFGEAGELVDRLCDADVAATTVPVEALGAAVSAVASQTSVVVVEADAVGPTHAAATPGSLALAATARAGGVPVWLVVPVGRVQPAAVWDRFAARLWPPDVPGWDAGCDLVPLDLVDVVVRPTGITDVAGALARPDCPDCPELFAGDVF